MYDGWGVGGGWGAEGTGEAIVGVITLGGAEMTGKGQIGVTLSPPDDVLCLSWEGRAGDIICVGPGVGNWVVKGVAPGSKDSGLSFGNGEEEALDFENCLEYGLRGFLALEVLDEEKDLSEGVSMVMKWLVRKQKWLLRKQRYCQVCW